MQTVTPVNGNKTYTLFTTSVDGVSDTNIKSSIWTWFQATITGTGAVNCDVLIEGSNDNVHWANTPIAVFSLTGTTSDSEGATVVSPVKYIRATVANISGTNAEVTVTYTV